MKQNSSWISQMFEPKDDEAWLRDLVSKSEISFSQYKYFKILLHEKPVEDMAEADRWWKDSLVSNFNVDHVVPKLVREHNLKHGDRPSEDEQPVPAKKNLRGHPSN